MVEAVGVVESRREERMMELVQKKYDLGIEIMDISDHVRELQETLAEASAQITVEVALAENAAGKRIFSNETARKAEHQRRMAEEPEFEELQGMLRQARIASEAKRLHRELITDQLHVLGLFAGEIGGK